MLLGLRTPQSTIPIKTSPRKSVPKPQLTFLPRMENYLEKYLLTFLIFLFAFHDQIQTSLAATIRYDLTAYYFESSPDGVQKQVLGVNGQFPGPTLRAKLGDTLIIRVTNWIKDEDGITYPTSVHWHGIEMHEEPFFDGPEAVTQCPIPYGQSMVYKYTLRQAGTYWYHSHHEWQYVEGYWGILIVDNVPNDVYTNFYNPKDELIIALNDWYRRPAKIIAACYKENQIPAPVPDTGLINGRGTYPCNLVRSIGNGSRCNSFVRDTCNPAYQSPALFKVTPGKTYKIRVINTSARANFIFSIDGHELVSVGVDGVDTVMVGPVDAVVVWPAQRYSFLVTMNGNADSYWIRTAMSSVATDSPKAILQYVRKKPSPCRPSDAAADSEVGVELVDRPVPGMLRIPGTQGRPATQFVDWSRVPIDYTYFRNGTLNTTAIGTFLVGIDEVGLGRAPDTDSATDTDSLAGRRPTPPRLDLTKAKLEDEKHRLEMIGVPIPTSTAKPTPLVRYLNTDDCRPVELTLAPSRFDQEFIFNVPPFIEVPGSRHGTINGISYSVAHTMPVLVEMKRGFPISLNSNPQYMIGLNQVIQVVINNNFTAAHPWHLHGHTFYVIGTGVQNSGNYNPVRDAASLRLNGTRRDTTSTPAKSWAVIRFVVDNPGAWLFHCHINWHLEVGLGAVFIEMSDILRNNIVVPDEARRICRLNGVGL